MTIDIFCEIIDNFGDIGVIYRFANELYIKSKKTAKIRVILNRISELPLLNSSASNSSSQILNDIEYLTLSHLDSVKETTYYPEIIVESFGCNLPQWYLEKAKSKSSLLINLEYLSSEEWTLDFHLKESLLGAEKLRKFFFMPGLSEKSGGVIIPSKFESSYKLLDYSPSFTEGFLQDKIIGTLFSYEYNFSSLFSSLEAQERESIILCLGEKTQNSIKEILKNEVSVGDFGLEGFHNLSKDPFYIGKFKKSYLFFLPFMNQDRYDALLSLCDFNFVRGEDSFVRGVLSGKPFLWHAYLQEDLIHLDKINGFFSVFSEFFKRYYPEKYDRELKEYQTLFIKYNHRLSNSSTENSELSHEFNLFFSNLDKLKEMNEIFSKYVIKNCNLIDKFYNFITQDRNIHL